MELHEWAITHWLRSPEPRLCSPGRRLHSRLGLSSISEGAGPWFAAGPVVACDLYHTLSASVESPIRGLVGDPILMHVWASPSELTRARSASCEHAEVAFRLLRSTVARFLWRVGSSLPWPGIEPRPRMTEARAHSARPHIHTHRHPRTIVLCPMCPTHIVASIGSPRPQTAPATVRRCRALAAALARLLGVGRGERGQLGMGGADREHKDADEGAAHVGSLRLTCSRIFVGQGVLVPVRRSCPRRLWMQTATRQLARPLEQRGIRTASRSSGRMVGRVHDASPPAATSGATRRMSVVMPRAVRPTSPTATAPFLRLPRHSSASFLFVTRGALMSTRIWRRSAREPCSTEFRAQVALAPEDDICQGLRAPSPVVRVEHAREDKSLSLSFVRLPCLVVSSPRRGKAQLGETPCGDEASGRSLTLGRRSVTLDMVCVCVWCWRPLQRRSGRALCGSPCGPLWATPGVDKSGPRRSRTSPRAHTCTVAAQSR